MPKPLVVSIPHRLGKDEALRRIKSGLAAVRAQYSSFIALQEESWAGDHLQFHISVLGQPAGGMIDVADDHVRLEVTLPWLLGMVAQRLTPMIQKEGNLMLEKK